MLHSNTEWAVNARFITGIGHMVYGFGRDGDLWSHDTILHVSRDYVHSFQNITGILLPSIVCISTTFGPPLVFNISPIIIGLTSDGNRLIFVSSGVLTASATDLLSLDELIFETFTYDVSLNGTTAMTWYAHVVH
jgi:hypothetical protein